MLFVLDIVWAAWWPRALVSFFNAGDLVYASPFLVRDFVVIDLLNWLVFSLASICSDLRC